MEASLLGAQPQLPQGEEGQGVVLSKLSLNYLNVRKGRVIPAAAARCRRHSSAYADAYADENVGWAADVWLDG